EPLANPFQHVLVLLMIRIANCFEEVAISPNAAAILRRTGPLSFWTNRVFLPWIGGQAALEENLVFPGITEIVLVLEREAFRRLREDFAEYRPSGVDALEILEPVVQGRSTSSRWPPFSRPKN